MKISQREKIARFDDVAQSRDRFELACYDLIVNRVRWSEWVTDRSVVIDSETPGRYRLGIIGEHRAAGRWFQLRPLHNDETVWHASYENAFGLWSITIHAGLIGLWIIGPFRLRRRKP